MAKATDEAGELLKERVAEAADDAAETLDEHSKALTKKVEELQKEVNKAREDIRLERGFRKAVFSADCIYFVFHFYIILL